MDGGLPVGAGLQGGQGLCRWRPHRSVGQALAARGQQAALVLLCGAGPQPVDIWGLFPQETANLQVQN